MPTAQDVVEPVWQHDEKNRIWYWYDAHNDVHRRWDDGSELDTRLLTPGQPHTAFSPSPPETRSSTSISRWSDGSSVSSRMPLQQGGWNGGLLGPRKRQGHSRQSTDIAHKLKFRVQSEPLKYFRPGTVFYVRRLYAVPSDTVPRNVADTRSDEKIFGLVVIKIGVLSCSVVPIVPNVTAGDIGHSEVQQYGIIYTGDTVPKTSAAEIEMQPLPVKVKPDDSEFRLQRSTRINYGKVHNIEHSAKVLPFGRVADGSRDHLLRQFANVWSTQLGVSLIREEMIPSGVNVNGPPYVPVTPVGEQSVQRSQVAPERAALKDTHDDQEPISTGISKLILGAGGQTRTPILAYLPLTQQSAHPTAPPWSMGPETTAAESASTLRVRSTALSPPTEQSPDQHGTHGNADTALQQAEIDRLYGRLKRYVGLHETVLNQRYDFESGLNSAWESLAQCLQMMDDAIKRRNEGLEAANEQLDEAFREAQKQVSLAKDVQKMTTAKQLELSTTETDIRDNTEEILAWRLASKETLERIDEMKALAVLASESASAFEAEDGQNPRPEVLAFRRAQERVGTSKMQLQEFDEEHEERVRRFAMASDRGEPTDPRFAALETEYKTQRTTLAIALEKDEMHLQARRKECSAVGIVFQDDSLLSNREPMDNTSHKSFSIDLHDEDGSLEDSSAHQQEKLALVDRWVQELPAGFGPPID
ncbi:hypothetical protein B0A48_15766 [Cryoendolithus antarcticus]|uniref:DUF6590 domain-containing protein n=1 Tax=Cryoendolithus antarcticus TaxID=1507870 RepID=A0A1V8SH87_9PEZI|nr:hypothetical protein B0A48_15766 [Cryoendolithus antarcticus]